MDRPLIKTFGGPTNLNSNYPSFIVDRLIVCEKISGQTLKILGGVNFVLRTFCHIRTGPNMTKGPEDEVGGVSLPNPLMCVRDFGLIQVSRKNL